MASPESSSGLPPGAVGSRFAIGSIMVDCLCGDVSERSEEDRAARIEGEDDLWRRLATAESYLEK